MSRPVTSQAFAHVLGMLQARERNELLRNAVRVSCGRVVTQVTSVPDRCCSFASAAGAAVAEAKEEEPHRVRIRPVRPPSIPCSLASPLPLNLHKILHRKDINAVATDFIESFSRSRLSARHLLHAPALQRLVKVWQTTAVEAHQWAWLAEQLEEAGLLLSHTPNNQNDILHSIVQSYLIIALVKTSRLPPAQQKLRTHIAANGLTHSHHISATSVYVEACLDASRPGDVVALVSLVRGPLAQLLRTPEANMPSPISIARLRNALMRAYREIPEPRVWLESLREAGSTEFGLHGTNLLRALLESLEGPRLDLALALYKVLAPSVIALDVASSLWSALDLAERFEDARAVYVSFRRGSEAISHVALSRALHMYTSRGWEQQADAVVDEIAAKGWKLQSVDKRNLLHCCALLGDVDGAVRLAELHFPGVLSHVRKPGRSPGIPHLHVLNLLLLAYVNAGRIDDSIPYLTAIMSSPTKPTIETYNTLLKAFVISGDVEGAVGVYDELLDASLVPNIVTFTSLIGLFANTRDPENARHTFSMMVNAGIEPDERAWAALVNAHIEAGQWSEVSIIWKDLPPRFKLKGSVVNAMLKAYVLLAVPFPVVERLFRGIQSVQTPQARAWAMVIQSACDSGDMVTARELYEEMDHLANRPNSTVTLNAYIYSILIAGYTRVRDGESATAVYEEMQRRGIAPTSVTYSMLISSLTNRNTVDSHQQARDFASALLERIGVDNLAETARSRARPLENVLGPIIIDAGRNYDVATARAYFDQVAPAGQPSVPAYTLLLDVYRKAGEVRSLLETWMSLFRVAFEPASQRKLFKQRGWSNRPDLARRNVLAIPLSIMIDGLSAAARYADIFKIWQQVKSAGFGFDAHNYNHLAVAMARSGDVEGAFRIVDRVLIPRSEAVSTRRMPPLRSPTNSDLLDDQVKGEAEDSAAEEVETKADPAQRPPNRRHADRFDRDYRGYRESEDFAVNTELLKQWRPSDLSWRPSLLTIAVLDRAYAQLQSSRGVWGAVGGEGEGEGEEMEDASSLPDIGGNVVLHGREGQLEPGQPVDKQSAWATLLKINRRYGKAVALIMLHRRKRNGGVS